MSEDACGGFLMAGKPRYTARDERVFELKQQNVPVEAIALRMGLKRHQVHVICSRLARRGLKPS